MRVYETAGANVSENEHSAKRRYKNVTNCGEDAAMNA